MSTTPDANKVIARYVAGVFGGKPSVIRYWNDTRDRSIDLLTCVDRPVAGVTSYCTLGLSDHPVLLDDDRRVPVELVGACATACEGFANALTTAAFVAMANEWQCTPGSVLQNALDMYKLSRTLKHFLFLPPFLWSTLKALKVDGREVHWLMAVPISDEEYRFWKEHGSDALESQFESAQIDVFDINRASAV
jgi:hypothetical protein